MTTTNLPIQDIISKVNGKLPLTERESIAYLMWLKQVPESDATKLFRICQEFSKRLQLKSNKTLAIT